MKKYAVYVPHSAKIDVQCKIVSLKLSGLVNVRIDKENDGRDIIPTVEDLKGSFSVLPSSLADTKTFCVLEAGLYDETGSIIYEMRKFPTHQCCTFIIIQIHCDFY